MAVVLVIDQVQSLKPVESPDYGGRANVQFLGQILDADGLFTL